MVPTRPSGKRQIEMRRLVDLRHRAAEQALVDEDADHRPLAGAVRRHHDVERKARRPSFPAAACGRRSRPTCRRGRTPPPAPASGRVGEADAIGRQAVAAALSPTEAAATPRVAASAGLPISRLAWTPRHRIRAAPACRATRTAASSADCRHGAGNRRDRRIEMAGGFGKRADHDETAGPAARHRRACASSASVVIAVMEADAPPDAASARATVSAAAISRGASRRPGSTTATSRGISAAVVATSSIPAIIGLDIDRGFRPDGQAVADRAHVDAAVLGRGAGIQERDFEESVLRSWRCRAGCARCASAPCRRARWRRRCGR